jgi:hypothetical protein
MSKFGKRLPKNATEKIGDHSSLSSVEGDVLRYFFSFFFFALAVATGGQ